MKAFEWLRDEEKCEKAEMIAGAALLLAALAADKLLGLTGWGRTALYLAAYAVSAARVLLEAVHDIREGEIFGEGTLMCVSTIGALALGEFPEAVAVMLFFRLGEAFEELAEDKSRRSISHLLELRSDTARVRRGGEWAEVDAAAVRVGDSVLVPPGGRFPLDGVVEEGAGSVDTSALTGESVPQDVKCGDEVLQGCVNGQSAIVIRVTKEEGESTASRILRMVEEAQEGKASREKFITRFSEKYTPAVVALAALLAVVPLFFGGEFSVWIRRALVFLVISCPCALVISVPLTFFGGIGAASRKGLLVRSGEALERLAYVKSAVFDKTGTLTCGEFAVKECVPAPGVTKEELLRAAAEAESFSTHPIAECIRRAAGDASMGEKAQEDREYPGLGVSVTRGGRVYAAGNAGLLRKMGYDAPISEDGGATAVYVTRDGKYIGYLTVADELRGDTRAALDALRKTGVERIAMLTGDAEGPARAIAGECGISEFRARQLPADKAAAVREMENAVFTGDGINDAPALASAYLGVAMGGIGSDAAIEAADAVVMNASLTCLPGAVRTARRTMRIVTENIVFSLAVKLVLMVLGVLGIAGMWLAVVGDVGVMILAVLNSMRMLRDR